MLTVEAQLSMLSTSVVVFRLFVVNSFLKWSLVFGFWSLILLLDEIEPEPEPRHPQYP
jgi:hypothetical protein